MEKSLSERIAQHEKNKKKADGSKNKVAFLALRNDIREALDAGWSMKSTWETLFDESKITFSYKTFRLYVGRYIFTETSIIKLNNNLLHALPPSKSVSESTDKKTVPPIPSFNFQATPNAKELL